MAAVHPPIFSPIPPDIQNELPHPFTPWKVSQDLFDGLQFPSPEAQYQKVQVFPNNQEWRFIWRYFNHLKPTKYSIKRVHFIRKRDQQIVFEANLSSIEFEATKFPPTWDQESRPAQRAEAIERWKETAKVFSHIETKLPDNRVLIWKHTKVIPLWHGTSKPICDSICNGNFVYFGKRVIPGAAAAPSQSTDDGYFGSGIYFTNSARYAADIYSQGHLLLGWVSMREPFPVVGDPHQTDMATLRGAKAYKNYNAHYVPVASIEPDNPHCQVYHPVQANQPPTCDEYVVFQSAQALPQYWVELELDLPYINVPSKIPRCASELIPHLMKILQNPQVDDDPKLRNFLGKHLTILLQLTDDEDIPPEQGQLYEQISQLVTPASALNKALRDHMVGAAAPEPLAASHELPGDEEKELSPAKALEDPDQFQAIDEPKVSNWRVAMAAQVYKGVLRNIQNEPWQLLFSHKSWKNNREFILAAVQGNGEVLKYTSKQLQNDKEVVLAAVQQKGNALQHASITLQDDWDVVLAAVMQEGHALKYASARLMGEKVIVFAAVQQGGRGLKYASAELQDDKEVVLAAVSKNGGAFEYASEQLQCNREFVITVVKLNRDAFAYVSNRLKKDEEIQSLAHKQECFLS